MNSKLNCVYVCLMLITLKLNKFKKRAVISDGMI